MELETTITDGSKKYIAELARVKDTHIGYEDHGIFSMNVNFEGVTGGWGQGLGHRFATNPVWLHAWVKSLVDLFGEYGSWEKIVGQECWILRNERSGPIVGLASKSVGRVLNFDEMIEGHRELAEAYAEMVKGQEG